MDITKFPEFQSLKLVENYISKIDKIRKDEFSRTSGMIYVDHAGSTLYSEEQLKSVFSSFNTCTFGNPHSRHLPSDVTTESIEAIRSRILGHFNTSSEEYDLIFTSGATEAISHVGNYFKWTWNKRGDASPGCLIYTQENHTSVLGLRGLADREGAEVHCISADEVELSFRLFQNGNCSLELPDGPEANCLFAYPAQCNFSGVKYPLSWIADVQNGHLDLKTYPMNKVKHNKKICFRKQKWFVLLDAACFVATCPLDLSEFKPDFVPISFYKMFGYPTGLGCLLVSRRAWPLLQSPYFGGGTVLMVDSRTMDVAPRLSLHEKFESGTVPFLAILSLEEGFRTLNRITGGMANVESHVFSVSRFLLYNLISLRHENGARVVDVYRGRESIQCRNHGSIVSFNIKNSEGGYVGFTQVEKAASLFNICLRTGCFCNPGACQKYLNISSEELKHQFKFGHVCGDGIDLVAGSPTGAVRVSFGYMSTYEDAEAVLTMIKECFVEGSLKIDVSWITEDIKPLKENGTVSHTLDCPSGVPVANGICGQLQRIPIVLEALRNDNSTRSPESQIGDVAGTDILSVITEEIERSQDIPSNPGALLHTVSVSSASLSHPLETLILTDIFIYPVKSCSGISMRRGTLSHRGLEYDRQWMVITSSGVTVTQKRVPALSLVRTAIDEHRNVLILSYPGQGNVEVTLVNPQVDEMEDHSAYFCGGRVCGDRVKGVDCGAKVGQWLCEALQMEGLKLIRQTWPRKSKLTQNGAESVDLSLANESQYLIIHSPSLRLLIKQLDERALETNMSEEELILRFRPNFVIDGGLPYEEDDWKFVTIGKIFLQVVGKCSRCQMVCVDPSTGERTKEPMLTLGATRGPSMKFGVHASFHSARPDHHHVTVEEIVSAHR